MGIIYGFLGFELASIIRFVSLYKEYNTLADFQMVVVFGAVPPAILFFELAILGEVLAAAHSLFWNVLSVEKKRVGWQNSKIFENYLVGNTPPIVKYNGIAQLKRKDLGWVVKLITFLNSFVFLLVGCLVAFSGVLMTFFLPFSEIKKLLSFFEKMQTPEAPWEFLPFIRNGVVWVIWSTVVLLLVIGGIWVLGQFLPKSWKGLPINPSTVLINRIREVGNCPRKGIKKPLGELVFELIYGEGNLNYLYTGHSNWNEEVYKSSFSQSEDIRDAVEDLINESLNACEQYIREEFYPHIFDTIRILLQVTCNEQKPSANDYEKLKLLATANLPQPQKDFIWRSYYYLKTN